MTALATSYFATTGSDRNGCTSSAPCLTITKGISPDISLLKQAKAEYAKRN